MNINPTSHSPNTNICFFPGSSPPVNPMTGRIASISNGQVDFNSKPSCWSSAKRTLMSVVRNFVGVFQSPLILTLQVPFCGTSAARTAGSSKESNEVRPFTESPRTFEYNSKVDDLPAMQNTPVPPPKEYSETVNALIKAHGKAIEDSLNKHAQAINDVLNKYRDAIDSPVKKNREAID